MTAEQVLRAAVIKHYQLTYFDLEKRINDSERLGRMPKRVCAGDSFAGEDNAVKALDVGVGEVVFGGKLKNELTRLVKSAWVQKQLRSAADL